ncbi:HU family DNA-binding protein [Halorubrum sp. JWXQ-INN 858]|nr:HU family DNA-binding protein [Halorubrum sp. JWXQ-INN 858]
MKKAELVEAMASSAGLSKADAKRALDGMVAATVDSLVKGDRVSLIGFGSFSVSKRAARTGRSNGSQRRGDAVSEGPVLFAPADEFVAALDPIPGKGDTRRVGRAGGPNAQTADVTVDAALLARRTRLSKADAKRALDGFTRAVAAALVRGDTVSLIGFGSFSVSKRSARTGRNPQTGKEVQVAGRNDVRFKAGAELSKSVN